MVFDENVHFSIIQAYAHQWGPFFPAHSTMVEPFGAVARDPSFLYRWLMSFPYRLVAHVTSDQMVQVIDLRFINIFMFGGGLVLFRRLLLKTKVSPAIINASLLFFVLMPVVPLLAGQINYDNLLMPVTAAALLFTLSVVEQFKQGKLPVARIAWLLTLCLLGSLVQVEFLPIFAAIIIFIAWQLQRSAYIKELRVKESLVQGWHSSGWGRKLAVLLPVILAFYLCFELFGVNLVRYHTLTPSCGQVLTARACQGDANWVRTQAALAHPAAANSSPFIFAASWTYRMFIALFFTNSGGQANYLSINPLPLIFMGALAVFGLGVLLFVRYRQAIFKGYSHMGFLVWVTFVYSAVLWLHNYHDYTRFGQKFAIQGRYLLPVALLAMVMLALAFKQLFGHRLHLKAGLVIGVFVLFLQGGGTLAYIVDSHQNWYWQNRAVVRLNQLAQQVVKPLILVRTPLKSFGRLD